MAGEMQPAGECRNGTPITAKGGDVLDHEGPGMAGDTGCRHSPSCLACHLPRCYWEMTPTERRRWAQAQRYGKTPEQVRTTYAFLVATGEALRSGFTKEELLRDLALLAPSARPPA